MLEHLKTMLVGLLAAHLAFGVIAAVIWAGYHYGEQIMLAILLMGLAGAIYGLGWSIRKRGDRLVRNDAIDGGRADA